MCFRSGLQILHLDVDVVAARSNVTRASLRPRRDATLRRNRCPRVTAKRGTARRPRDVLRGAGTMNYYNLERVEVHDGPYDGARVIIISINLLAQTERIVCMIEKHAQGTKRDTVTDGGKQKERERERVRGIEKERERLLSRDTLEYDLYAHLCCARRVPWTHSWPHNPWPGDARDAARTYNVI